MVVPGTEETLWVFLYGAYKRSLSTPTFSNTLNNLSAAGSDLETAGEHRLLQVKAAW
jgi:hypothetical protein